MAGHIPGHPSPPTRPRRMNVVLFGETGVGKSSVINLIAQHDVAKVSSDVLGRTMRSIPYDISFDNMDFTIFDTIGLEEPEMGVNGYLEAIDKAYELIVKLSATGGIHLLLFCMRGGMVTATTQSNYRFFESLCSTKVPIALVVTGLEREVDMEDWWVRNKTHLKHYGIESNGHACITAVQGSTPEETLKYKGSQMKIRELLKTCALKDEAIFPEQHPWFTRLGRGMRSFIEKHKKPRKKDIMAVLTRRCKLDPETAKRIADMMERGDSEMEEWEKDKNTNDEALAQIRRAHEQKHQCEALYAQGRNIEAAGSLLEIVNTMGTPAKADKLITDWIVEFTSRCMSTLERIGDEASEIKDYDKAILAYSNLLSHGLQTPNSVLIKWVRMTLIRGPVNDALEASTKFKLSRFAIYRVICDALEENGRVIEAITCFRQMQGELVRDTDMCDERGRWEPDFQQRCTERLEKLGSVAMDCKNYTKAVEHFSTMLSLDSVNRMEIFIKRSEAQVLMKSWDGALRDADEGIELDPSSHRGFEMRHAALRGAGRHAEAAEAFRMMLWKLEGSPDERMRELRCQYVDATPTIRAIVQQTLRTMPRVLIDTTSGRLCDKKQQAEAFEALPIYNELVSLMTTKIDYARIWREVKEFYRYVMLSHKWEEYGEPLFQKVERITVYKLEASSTNMKLQGFCNLARSLGFRWAWSDTSCVDKDNNVVLQESLVAMFTWYRGSSLTVVYLRDVSSRSQKPGGLRGSIWNIRAWTYQEYVAAEVVRFYTEDWQPYLGLNMSNHKESTAIISEMQQGTTGSAQDITVLRPGLERVREKLSLASMRQSTLVEDIAYSLLGIFNVSIPVIYGEGDRAVGRLLEHILTGSGDVTILAWTGRAGSYNSCLPMDLTVYNQVVPPHVPQLIEDSEMDSMVVALRSSLPDLSLAMVMHNRLHELPSPSAAASRLRLPGIAIHLVDLVHASSDVAAQLRVYRATTPIFGDIEIKTADDLATINDLYLVYPWIRPLLDQEFRHGAGRLDKTTQALRLVACLRRPFGALLLEQQSLMEYRRVAADSLIMVRISEEVPLTELIENIRMIEVQ